MLLLLREAFIGDDSYIYCKKMMEIVTNAQRIRSGEQAFLPHI